MNDNTVADWKQWVEKGELASRSIPLKMIRPPHPPINVLSNVSNGVHPYHGTYYERIIYGTDGPND